jgi:hypothetical protein
MSHSKPRHRNLNVERLAQRLTAEYQHLAPFFARFNASLRSPRRSSYRAPVVERLTDFLIDPIGFVFVTNHNGVKKGNKKQISERLQLTLLALMG